MEGRLPESDRPPLWDAKSLHLSEDALEAYSLNRISSEEDAASLEEHLLVCPHCQDRLEKLDSFHSAVKSELQDLQANPHPIRRPRAYNPMAVAAAAALLLLIPFALQRWNSPQEAILLATRADSAASLPAGRALVLTPDCTGLPATTLAWELVAEGTQQTLAKGQLEPGTAIRIDALKSGAYWLRLASPPDPTIPLREFSLVVR